MDCTQHAAMTKAEKISHFLISYVLPVGWVVTLTGMFWLRSHWQYHRVFEWTLILPCLLVFCFCTKSVLSLIRSRIFVAFLAFSCYMLATIMWSENQEDIFWPIIKCVLVFMFLLSAGLLVTKNDERLVKILALSGIVATVSAVFSLCFFTYESRFSGYIGRLPGYGVLSNPLLTAHVYGAFACYWLARLVAPASTEKRISPLLPLCCLSILALLLIATGSRTPFLALGLALIWLLLTTAKLRVVLIGLLATVLLVLVQYVLTEHILTEHVWQGFSYRPKIWSLALQQIAEKPWFGYGFTSPTIISGADLPFPMVHPHNVLLLVAYQGGLVGLILWGAIYVYSLHFAWQKRQNNLVLIASTWLVYGLGAGLTDSPHIMPRPNEVWFLLWIPLALLLAASWAEKRRNLSKTLSDGAA
jgi:O-antigen ligase